MSTSPKAAATFTSANPHALATILEASETKRIIAATDIFDISGMKLWARDQPVSAALQRKLLDRQLKKPLESCLLAEDGVTAASLGRALQALLQGDSPLAPVLRAQGGRLMHEVAYLPIHPVVQLLLTAAESARPASFQHAVTAMALAGALMAGAQGDRASVRLAMLGGLVHDLGELYIAPTHGEAEADREPEFASYQQLVVHPHVGALLLRQLTDYPTALARAVLEHHECLDGSGYPHALHGEQMSTLGRLLAVVEAALNAVRSPLDSLLRASVALRAVPGEYDPHWAGRISRVANAQGPALAVMSPADIEARLAALGDVLTAAEIKVDALAARPDLAAARAPLALARFLVARLRKGWNESGLWNPRAIASGDAAEVEALEDELYFRLRAVQRATQLNAGDLPPQQVAALQGLFETLAMG